MPSKSCSACGASWSIYDRICECGVLVHAEELAELRTGARIGRMANDPKMVEGALRRAIRLVPEDHPEHAALLTELDTLLAPQPPPPPASHRASLFSRLFGRKQPPPER